MKRIKNLTENKDLINTFKKTKFRNYLNKAVFKKKNFFFLKYKQLCFKKLFKFLFKFFFYKSVFLYFKNNSSKNALFNINFKENSNYFKILLMFIDLYFY